MSFFFFFHPSTYQYVVGPTATAGSPDKKKEEMLNLPPLIKHKSKLQDDTYKKEENLLLTLIFDLMDEDDG